MQQDEHETGKSNDCPVALVAGEKLAAFPDELYIPPDALRIFLDSFEGPLDLLLYLIRKKNIDILELPIAAVTEQYMTYIEMMHEVQIDVAAEYLVMASTLAEIKSRSLLPRANIEDEDEDDPRAELVRRLLEYQRFKHAAENIDALPRMERDHTKVAVEAGNIHIEKPQPTVALSDIVAVLRDVLERAELHRSHYIERESLSVKERMTIILTSLAARRMVLFSSCFTPEEGRDGVIVTLLAILELSRAGSLDFVQPEPYAPIYLRGSV